MKVYEEIKTMVGTVAEDEENLVEEKDFEGEEEEETPPQPSPEGREEDEEGEDGEDVFDEMNKPNTVDVPDESENKDIRNIEIEVDYSDYEINKMANKLNDLYGEKLALDDEKKASSDHYNGLIKEKEAEMKEVHKKILQRSHTQYVPCRLEFNYETNSKEYVNTMTGEVVKSEAITSEMDSLFQKPLDEGEYPESDGFDEEKDGEVTGDDKPEEIDGDTISGDGMTVMEFITDEPMSTELPPIPQWGDILKKEVVNGQQ